jgi:hypothetical protein
MIISSAKMPTETASIRAGSYYYSRKIDCLNLRPGPQKSSGRGGGLNRCHAR